MFKLSFTELKGHVLIVHDLFILPKMDLKQI